jgi:AraC family transcriptional regulator
VAAASNKQRKDKGVKSEPMTKATSNGLALWPETPRCPLSTEVMRTSQSLHGTRRSWRYRQPVVALVTGGYFGYRTEREVQMGLPGLVIAGNADEAFEADHCCPEGNQRLVVFFDQTVLEDVACNEGLDSAHFLVSSFAPGKVSALICAWIKLLCAHRADEALAYSLACRLLNLGRAEHRCARSVPPRRSALLDAILYVQDHFDEPCSLETLAAVSGLSRYHFLRSFQRLVGTTPRQYVLHVRLIAAAHKLIASSETVSQIALDVGFNDLSHFYCLFVERFGQPPARWRALH